MMKQGTNGQHAANANRVERPDSQQVESRRQPTEPAHQGFQGLNSVAEQAVERITALMERKPLLIVCSATVVGLIAGLILKRSR